MPSACAVAKRSMRSRSRVHADRPSATPTAVPPCTKTARHSIASSGPMAPAAAASSLATVVLVRHTSRRTRLPRPTHERRDHGDRGRSVRRQRPLRRRHRNVGGSGRSRRRLRYRDLVLVSVARSFGRCRSSRFSGAPLCHGRLSRDRSVPDNAPREDRNDPRGARTPSPSRLAVRTGGTVDYVSVGIEDPPCGRPTPARPSPPMAALSAGWWPSHPGTRTSMASLGMTGWSPETRNPAGAGPFVNAPERTRTSTSYSLTRPSTSPAGVHGAG